MTRNGMVKVASLSLCKHEYYRTTKSLFNYAVKFIIKTTSDGGFPYIHNEQSYVHNQQS